jgi:purine-binding chemotaxis protein CheW
MQTKQLVLFSLGKETYAFPITDIKEIVRFREISRVPETPDYIEGMINLRGKVITVIHLGKLLDCPVSAGLEDSMIMVEKGSDIGFLVDEVNEIRTVEEEDMLPYRNVSGHFETSYVRNIAKIGGRVVAVIDTGGMPGQDTGMQQVGD